MQKTILFGLTVSCMCALACCSGVPAQRNPLSPSMLAVVSIVPFAQNAGSEDAQKECVFQQQLPWNVEARAKSAGIQTRLVESESLTSGSTVLRMETLAANVRGGGGWTGDKWVVVRGTLTRGEELIGNFRIRESVGGGKYGACETFEELSSDMSKRVVDFLLNPQLDYVHGF